MNISVLGAGNGGSAVAAQLSLNGHDVSLIKTSQGMHDQHFQAVQKSQAITLVEDGRHVTARIKRVSRDLSLLRNSQVVILYIQSRYHEPLIRRLKQHLKKGQLLLINPGYLSTAYVLKHLAHLDLTVAEAQSSFLDCRIIEPGIIRVGFRNVRNPLGIFPARHMLNAQNQLDQLGFPFTYLPSVVEAGLHNPNLIVHTVGALMSIPRIERKGAAYCMYHEVFTPSVWRILEALDREKMDVMEQMGAARLPYVEACKLRNTLDESRDAKEVFFWYAGMPTRAKGPSVVDSRYLSEDVPQGLVLLESLGRLLGVQTPVCTGIIYLACAALGRDLRAEGRTLSSLGKDNVLALLEDRKKPVRYREEVIPFTVKDKALDDVEQSS